MRQLELIKKIKIGLVFVEQDFVFQEEIIEGQELFELPADVAIQTVDRLNIHRVLEFMFTTLTLVHGSREKSPAFEAYFEMHEFSGGTFTGDEIDEGNRSR